MTLSFYDSFCDYFQLTWLLLAQFPAAETPCCRGCWKMPCWQIPLDEHEHKIIRQANSAISRMNSTVHAVEQR